MGNATIDTETGSDRRSGGLFRALLKWLGFLVLLAGFSVGAVMLQNQRLRQIQSWRPYVDRLILPRTEYAKALAFGYDKFVADFLYLRSIQAFGGQWRTGMTNIKGIYHYFYTVTELDPKFSEAYEFGSLVIGDEAKEPKTAIALNQKGWIADPDNYKLAYLNGYTAYYTMKDVPLAKLWIRLATQAKDCPDFVRRFEYFFDKESGNYQAAVERWIWEYLNAIDTGSSINMSIALRQIQIVTNDWNESVINKTLETYLKDHAKQSPSDLGALAEAGYFDNYSACDYFRLMAMLDVMKEQKGKAAAAQDAIVKACIRQMSGVPVAPYGDRPGEDFYFIRKDVTPDDYEASLKSGTLVFCKESAKTFMRDRSLVYVRSLVKKYKEKHRKWPPTMEEAFSDAKSVKIYDPLTGTWDYDAQTGAVKSPTFPKL